MSALVRLAVPVVLIVTAAAVLGWLCDRNGYARAKAHYEPILLQVASQAFAAEERAKAADAAAAVVNTPISTEVQKRAAETIRERDALARELGAMRVRLASALARRCTVPPVPGDAAGAARAASDASERFRRADERLAGVVASCKRDGDRYELAGRWYREQRAAYEALTTVAAQPAPQTR